ncbi:MAG: hypothetical protein GC178_01420 [Flavobacteriales bacterium]|nr:hypothetical protein [Flavobacteriales bacterium]
MKRLISILFLVSFSFIVNGQSSKSTCRADWEEQLRKSYDNGSENPSVLESLEIGIYGKDLSKLEALEKWANTHKLESTLLTNVEPWEDNASNKLEIQTHIDEDSFENVLAFLNPIADLCEEQNINLCKMVVIEMKFDVDND